MIIPSTGFSLSYDWKEGVSGMVTRCFDVPDVKVECEDLSEPGQTRERVEELAISATDLMRRKFIYSYERGNPRSLCQEHFRKIRALLRRTPQVCITGGMEWEDSKEKSTNSKWMALETPRGRVLR